MTTLQTAIPARAGTLAIPSVDRWGTLAALAVVALIPIQFAVFVIWPPPADVAGTFSLFEENALAGLLAFDLLLLASWLLSAIVFAALFYALRDRGPLIGFSLGAELVALATYFSSNTGFSLLSLSQQYGAAAGDAERTVLLAAGQAMLSLYTGTAFDVSYVLSGAAALLASLAMLRSARFGRTTAYVGIAYAILQALPPTAGTAGMAVSVLSLVPMVAWLVLIARGLGRR